MIILLITSTALSGTHTAKYEPESKLTLSQYLSANQRSEHEEAQKSGVSSTPKS